MDDAKNAPDKAKKREIRKSQLEELTREELENIDPYRHDQVTGIKKEPNEPTKLSKAEMIEAILTKEGLGGK